MLSKKRNSHSGPTSPPLPEKEACDRVKVAFLPDGSYQRCDDAAGFSPTDEDVEPSDQEYVLPLRWFGSEAATHDGTSTRS